MKSLSTYDCVLLDFDGLLVDTEPLHYAAYMRMCARRGYGLKWSYEKFCQVAHVKASGFFEALRRECPVASEVPESVLYEEKKRAYVELLQTEPCTLMSGVEEFLNQLQALDKPRAVVTNSPRSQIELIRSKLPLLDTIPLWITREDYAHPKPAPEGYQMALSRLGCQKGIGFEDSLKGLRALLDAGVDAVLVCSPLASAVNESLRWGACHIPTLRDIVH